MTRLTSDMRLKVKRDTFFLPDPNSGVYFRNNLSSFRMEGSTVDQWIEKLVPMLNGEYTLGDLTNGLPGPYRDRVYEIAEVLYQNGFVRDVSQDRPHQLSDQVFKKYASQIEFLDHFGDSGAYRFQVYRQSKVLAVGSGSFFVSLASALIESGIAKFHMVVANSDSTNRQRLKELEVHARKTDPEVAIEEIIQQKEGESFWREIVQPFDSILYVSQGDLEELRILHKVCREQKKVFIPAICLQQVGLAGPLVHSDSDGCWESAWRRIHQSVFCKVEQLHDFSATAQAMLANVIVFQLFKKITGVLDLEEAEQLFLLDLETLEGGWHSFMPHPLVTGRAKAKWVQDFDLRLEQRMSKTESKDLFLSFSQLTSEKSGIFHLWEEGDLKQLPLAQCSVQTVDPLSEGPVKLLPTIICTGLTHEEARREAGLSGIEMYVTRMISQLATTLELEKMIEPQEYVGIGAGETLAEGVCRGLQRCLAEEQSKQKSDNIHVVTPVQLSTVEDKRCQFYLQALATMHGEPIIGLGEEVSGFPVMWVSTNHRWYSSVGLNQTMALQKALQRAIMEAQSKDIFPTKRSSVVLEEKAPLSIEVASCDKTTQTEVLQSAIQVLKRKHKRLLVLELELEPFIKGEQAGVFGVLLREEESR
ncbi:putative thiazole-containing bacteriocin maturation protein [Bacillus chungangensis]|uniref:Thiazole-containing bacteriocin maturation protein n=1 Tax=Bacillus chungangensis TaxID=587633 RepID=A0ABT9WRH7_9BACI|nr:putative thiazole-containing bacteriocin maturation protein [Bacillus chungangensis]MDQ0175900.1 putative thiazole-containing bacteriocin maturation protein [Bacillus chungangensis]